MDTTRAKRAMRDIVCSVPVVGIVVPPLLPLREELVHGGLELRALALRCVRCEVVVVW